MARAVRIICLAAALTTISQAAGAQSQVLLDDPRWYAEPARSQGPPFVPTSTGYLFSIESTASFINCRISFAIRLKDVDGNVIAESPEYSWPGWGQQFTASWSFTPHVLLEAGKSYTPEIIAAPYNGNCFEYLHSMHVVGMPALIQSLQQRTTGPLAEGDLTGAQDVEFSAVPIGHSGRRVRLQVELRSGEEPFTGENDGGILSSDLVQSGAATALHRGGLVQGAYKWRARTADEFGETSDWLEFGRPGNVDFFVVLDGTPDGVLYQQPTQLEYARWEDIRLSLAYGPYVIVETFHTSRGGFLSSIEASAQSHNCGIPLKAGVYTLTSGGVPDSRIADSTNTVSDFSPWGFSPIRWQFGEDVVLQPDRTYALAIGVDASSVQNWSWNCFVGFAHGGNVSASRIISPTTGEIVTESDLRLLVGGREVKVTNLEQRDATALLAAGASTRMTQIHFGAVVQSAFERATKLQIELRRSDEAFTGTLDGGILESDLGASPRQVALTRGGLVEAGYRWRARAVDADGNSSEWMWFHPEMNAFYVLSERPGDGTMYESTSDAITSVGGVSVSYEPHVRSFSFQAGRSGTLQAITAWVRYINCTVPMQVDLYTADDSGVPTSLVATAQSVANWPTFYSFGEIRWGFGDAVQLVADANYALVITQTGNYQGDPPNCFAEFQGGQDATSSRSYVRSGAIWTPGGWADIRLLVEGITVNPDLRLRLLSRNGSAVLDIEDRNGSAVDYEIRLERLDDAAIVRTASALHFDSHITFDSLQNDVAFRVIVTPNSGTTQQFAATVVPGLDFDPKRPEVPVLFLHGWNSNSSTWKETRDYLEKTLGWRFGGTLYHVEDSFETQLKERTEFDPGADFFLADFGNSLGNYGDGAGELHQGAEVAAFVGYLKQNGINRLTLVAHSMGGLAARSFLASSGDSELIDRLITYGTPHAGIAADRLKLINWSDRASLLLDVLLGFSPQAVGLSPWTTTPGELFAAYMATDGARDASYACDDGVFRYSDFLSGLPGTLPQNVKFTAIYGDYEKWVPWGCGVSGSDALVPNFSAAANCIGTAPIPIPDRVIHSTRRHDLQTSDVSNVLCALDHCLSVRVMSPVDVKITDPHGRRLSESYTSIPGASVMEVPDENGHLVQTFVIPHTASGAYQITATAKPTANEHDVYSIIADVDGKTQVLADAQPVRNIPTEPYVVTTNRPPVAVVGEVPPAECDGPDGRLVTLSGAGSSDPDGDALSYEWRDAAGRVLGSTAVVAVKAALGTTPYTLTVSDGNGGTASAQVSVVVRDTIAPTLELSADPLALWPPDGKLVPVNVTVKSVDACDAQPQVRLSGINSSEAVARAFSADALIGTDDRQFSLRAERNPSGGGRTYFVEYESRDRNGNVAVKRVEISVPHDQRP